MSDVDADRRSGWIAGGLMRMALALLDRDREALAAARLQHAIDTLEGRKAAVAAREETIIARRPDLGP